MIPISINEFAKSYVRHNQGEDLTEVKTRLKEAVRRKKAGARCVVCGAPIWAIGSAIVFDGCFTCITGESDHSEDYEIDEVCDI